MDTLRKNKEMWVNEIFLKKTLGTTVKACLFMPKTGFRSCNLMVLFLVVLSHSKDFPCRCQH